MRAIDRYNLWLKNVKDAVLLTELSAMDKGQIENAFYRDLVFGTAGLRGEIGVGTNCLNIYTVARVTKGIALNMRANGHMSAAISYDSRINSNLFARVTASVFAQNGIRVILTRELMPVPFLSFLLASINNTSVLFRFFLNTRILAGIFVP